MTRIILIIILLAGNTVAGQRDDSSPDSSYTEYGSKFECVFQIKGAYQDNTNFAGSAVAIDNNHILTAAHIVNNYKECYVIDKNNQKFLLSNIKTHPEFKEQNYGFADIAIAHSTKGFNLKIYPVLYKDEDEVSKVCAIAGYGMSGTFSDKTLIFDSKIRAGTNTIDGIEKDMITCSVSKKLDKDYTNLEYLISPGDSGGGLFIDSKLAGINSCVTVTRNQDKVKIREESGHTRISKFISWIENNKLK